MHGDIMGEECDRNSSSNISDVVLANNTLPSDLAVPLYGYALPIIVILTAVANTLIVTVLIQRHMRTPTNVLLIAISLSDLFTLISPAPVFFYMYTLGHHENPIFPISLCYTWYYFYDIIPNTFHTTSIWLTLTLGIQRYVYVCHPSSAKVYCSVPKVIKAIALLFITASLHQGIRFFEFSYEEVCVIWNGELLPACLIFYSKWVLNSMNIYFTMYFWFRVLVVHLGPCTILVVLNILLFRALKKAEKKRKILLKENKKRECLRLRDSNCTTMMLIVILSVFLITEIPLAVITLLHIFSSQGFINLFTSDEYYVIQKFFIVSNFFITLSYPINFAIYCGMSRQFLETFRDTFFRPPHLCKQRISNFSFPTSQRSSITAYSQRQRQNMGKVSTQCCVSTIVKDRESFEPSKDQDDMTESLHGQDKEITNTNHSSRSVSFILQENSKTVVGILSTESEDFPVSNIGDESKACNEILYHKLPTVQETEI